MTTAVVRWADDLQRRPRAFGPAAVIVLVISAAASTWMMVANYHDQPDWMEDLAVYVGGARWVVHGQSLYAKVLPPPVGAEGAVSGGYAFTYPPFAALIFIPLLALSTPVLNVVMTAVNVVLLQAVVATSIRWAGVRNRAVLVAGTAIAAPVLIWFSPVYATLAVGQINLLLVLLVLGDLYFLRRSRWAGIGIGIATALKLTPAVFIIYLVLTRRFWAAITAAATLAATILISLIVLPSDTLRYWGGIFLDTNRVAIPQMRFNQSINGVLIRLLHTADVTVPWVIICLVVAIAGFALAWLANRRGEEQFAVLITAGIALLVSPVSWEHHWVWLVPAIIYLLVRAIWSGTIVWPVLLVLFVIALLIAPYGTTLVPADPQQVLHISSPIAMIAASWLPLLAVICWGVLAAWIATHRPRAG